MKHTPCERVRGGLADYQAGLVDERRRAEIDAHLAECADCRAELQALETTSELLDQTEPLRPSRDLWPAIARQLAPRKPARAWWRSFVPSTPRAAVALGAVVVLLVALAIIFPVHSERPPVPLLHATDEDAAFLAQWHAESSLASGLADRYSLALVALTETQHTEEAHAR